MNCSLIVEDTILEYKDLRTPIYIAFVDAKSDFDVVSYDGLLWKLFHAGVDVVSWSLIESLHAEAEFIVKWNGAYFSKWTRLCGKEESQAWTYTSFILMVLLTRRGMSHW